MEIRGRGQNGEWSQWSSGGGAGAGRGAGGAGHVAAGGPAAARGRRARGFAAARAPAVLRRLGRPVRGGCGSAGVPGTVPGRRFARLRLPRASRRGAAARRGLWHRARSAGAPPARVPLPARRGRQRGDAGAGAEHRPVPGAAAVCAGPGAAARARRALRRRDRGGGAGRGAGAQRGGDRAAPGHQAGRFPLHDDQERPLEPAVQGGAGGGTGAAGGAGSLAEGPGPGGGALGEGNRRGGQHPGHRLHLRGGLCLPEMPLVPPRGRLRANVVLGSWVSTWPRVKPNPETLLELGSCWGVTMFFGSFLIPFPSSFSPGDLARSSAWGGSPGFTGVSWAPLFALTFRYCPQHLGPHRHILQTDCSDPSPVQDFFSLPCSPLSPHGQNLNRSSSSRAPEPCGLYLGSVGGGSPSLCPVLPPSASSPGLNPAHPELQETSTAAPT